MSNSIPVKDRLRGTGRVALALGLLGLLAGPSEAQNRPVVIKLATLAPRESVWHEILRDMGEEWSRVSNGQVRLTIYPGGVAGEEADILRKMRIGQLHAGTLALPGLARISESVLVLAIPMAMESWESLDRVREVMQPRLEEVFLERGYVLLHWGDAGWVRFFLPDPDVTPDAVRRHRFVAWSDDAILELWRESGFQNVYLNLTDILPGLQTGMIDALFTTPPLVLANQWFPFVPHMLDMPPYPLVGATIVDRRAWERIPAELRPRLEEIARRAGERFREESARIEDAAIAEMQARGLQIVEPSEEIAEAWRAIFESAYPKMRGPMVPAEWFDEALRLARGG